MDKVIYKLVLHVNSTEKEELDLWLKEKTTLPDVPEESLKEPLRSANAYGSHAFLPFIQCEIANSNLKESTKKNHRTTYAVLKRYREKILFSDLTFEFVASFEHYLITNGYHINTVAKHLKHLKRYVNIAINKEYMDVRQYAFRKFRIRSVESQHSYLSPEELGSIEKLKLTGRYERLQKSLDAFLFCCYAGLRYSDFTSLNSSNLVVMDSKIWLIYRSVKTKIEVRLPLYLLFDGKGVEILQRYKEEPDRLFELRNNSNVNKELLIISKLAGVTKRISFHTARHTNATLLIYIRCKHHHGTKVIGA